MKFKLLLFLMFFFSQSCFSISSLGVDIEYIPSNTEGYYNIKIKNIHQDSPAYQLGLHKGDVFVNINNHNVFDYGNVASLKSLVDNLTVGKKNLSLKVRRQKNGFLWDSEEDISFEITLCPYNQYQIENMRREFVGIYNKYCSAIHSADIASTSLSSNFGYAAMKYFRIYRHEYVPYKQKIVNIVNTEECNEFSSKLNATKNKIQQILVKMNDAAISAGLSGGSRSYSCHRIK